MFLIKSSRKSFPRIINAVSEVAKHVPVSNIIIDQEAECIFLIKKHAVVKIYNNALTARAIWCKCTVFSPSEGVFVKVKKSIPLTTNSIIEFVNKVN